MSKVDPVSTMRFGIVAVLLSGWLPEQGILTRPPDISFRIHMIDSGASETAAFADINKDGRLDIVSGESWYESPFWSWYESPFWMKHKIRSSNHPLEARTIMLHRLVSLSLGFLLATGAGTAAQQSASSAIIGSVTDTTQAVLPGATVTVTQVGTGARRVVVTDSDGRFSVPGLRAATYELRVELDGFRTAEIQALVLREGETVRQSVTMPVATIAENVTVVGESPLLQTASATVGTVIDERVLGEIPVAGRTVLNVTTLAPGVTPRDFNRTTFFGRRDQYVTVEGGRDSSTNYAIDGVYVRSLRWNNMSVTPALDSIQEVNLLRNAFSTEYGQGQAVVSMVTKAGSNRVTGSGFEYFRNKAMNARSYFERETSNFDRNQYGFTLGGPVVRSKLFGFGAVEKTGETHGEVNFANVPPQNWLHGDFADVALPILDPLTGLPFPGNQIPQGRFSKFATEQLSTIPLANNSGANNYRVVRNFTDDTKTATFRFDQVANAGHTLFERFIWYDSFQVLPGAVTDSGRPQQGKNLALGHTWVVSKRVVNEIRAGYNFGHHNTDALFQDEDPRARNWISDLGLRNLYGSETQKYYGRPGATIQGYGGVVPGTGYSNGAADHLFSVSNATSIVASAHSLRFGFQAELRKVDMDTTTGARGGFTFNGRATGRTNSLPHSVADFLLGYCSTCTGTFGSADATYKSPTLAPFIDDVWQVNNRVTLQMGLRWEYLAPWHEINDNEGSFDPATGKIGFHKVPANLPASLLPLIITQDNFYPAGIVQKDLNNFGPRLGLVYSLNDRMVVRGGFGLYYDNLNLNELQFTRLIPPFTGMFNLSPTGTALVNVADLFPDPRLSTSFPTPFSMDPNNVTAWVRQWNVNVQRTLARSYLFEVAYTGSQSRHEHKRYNLNQPREGTTPQVERLPYPQFAPAILTSTDFGHGDFNGVSFRLDKRFSQGLFFTGSYQLSKNMDNNSGEIEANDTAFAWNPEVDWALSRYDRRHRSSISFGYELPLGDAKRWLNNSGALQSLLGNWQVSGAIRMQSGIPFSVSVSPLQPLGSFVPARANFAPGRAGDAGKLSNPSQQKWFDPAAYTVPPAGFQGTAGRNTLIGPPFRRTDAALSKRFRLRGSSRLELRAEIFNLLNNTNFGVPSANISNPDVGIITTADQARYMQLVARMIW
jgi:hypothetical protein